MLLSDNFFRPQWCGIGDRRLKNVSLILEWIPEAVKDHVPRLIAFLMPQFLKQGKDGKFTLNLDKFQDSVVQV